MIAWLRCKHPARALHIRDARPTVEPKDADFQVVTFHLYCTACGAQIDKKCLSLIGGVDEFLARGEATKEQP